MLCAGLRLCLRGLHRQKERDEMPFALALTLELTWITPQQRQELQSLAPMNPTSSPRWPPNVIDFSTYYPDRALVAQRRGGVHGTPITHPGLLATNSLGRLARSNVPTPALLVAIASMILSPLLFYWPDLSSGEYVTGTGEHRSIPLADGSTLTMSSRSRLRVRFSSSGRDIELLEGEALFSVAHEAARPFRVHTRHAVVEALGTEFSVYHHEDDTQIAVTQGRVTVFESLDPTPLILNPDGLIRGDTAVFEYPPPARIAIGAGHEARVSQKQGLTDLQVETRWVPTEELERHIAWISGPPTPRLRGAGP
jgi:hypothetical protein